MAILVSGDVTKTAVRRPSFTPSAQVAARNRRSPSAAAAGPRYTGPGRHLMDVRVCRIYEGTDEILKLKIAAAVLGKEFEAFK